MGGLCPRSVVLSAFPLEAYVEAHILEVHGAVPVYEERVLPADENGEAELDEAIAANASSTR
jgi:hypothetical protein